MKKIKGPRGTVLPVSDEIADMVLKNPEFHLVNDDAKPAADAEDPVEGNGDAPVDGDGEGPADDGEPAEDIDTLRADAEAAGVKVDKRWGVERLRTEIETAKAAE